jgi:hypothetical protein
MNMTAFLKGILLTMLLTALSTPGRADFNKALISLEFTHAPAGSDDGQVIVLLGDDGYWQEVQNEQVRWRMRIDASWNALHKPEEVQHAIQLRPAGYAHEPNFHTCADLPTCTFTNWKQATQEEPFHRNFGVPYSAAFADDTLFADPVAQCNNRRAQLLNQGKQLRHVLSNDLTIPQHAMSWLAMWGEATQVYKELQVPLTVVCKGDVQLAEELDPHPGANSQNVALSFQVTDAFLSILPGHKTTTSCPAELSFIGRIYTAGNGPATVEYRFEWPTGQKSTRFSVVVEDGSREVDISHKVAVPLSQTFAPGARVPGGGRSAAAGGGFVPNPQTQPSDQPSGGMQPQGATVTGNALPGNEHKGEVRLVVLSHGNVVSQPAGYHIVCEPNVSGSVAGPGGLTAPSREPVQGDPDQPVIIGTLPNPDETPGLGERASGREQPSVSQPRQSDTEFLRSPASRVPDPRTPAQPMPEARAPASRAPASPTPETRMPASRAPASPTPETRMPASRMPASPTPESLPASRTAAGRAGAGQEAFSRQDTRRMESERPAADDDSSGEEER